MKRHLTRPLKDQGVDGGQGILRGGSVDKSQVSDSPLCPPSWPSVDEGIEGQRQEVILRAHTRVGVKGET